MRLTPFNYTSLYDLRKRGHVNHDEKDNNNGTLK